MIYNRSQVWTQEIVTCHLISCVFMFPRPCCHLDHPINGNPLIHCESADFLRKFPRDFDFTAQRILLDGDPHGFTLVFGLDDFLFEAVNPDVAVEDFADFAVFAYEDAAFGVF